MDNFHSVTYAGGNGQLVQRNQTVRANKKASYGERGRPSLDREKMAFYRIRKESGIKMQSDNAKGCRNEKFSAQQPERTGGK